MRERQFHYLQDEKFVRANIFHMRNVYNRCAHAQALEETLAVTLVSKTKNIFAFSGRLRRSAANRDRHAVTPYAELANVLFGRHHFVRLRMRAT